MRAFLFKGIRSNIYQLVKMVLKNQNTFVHKVSGYFLFEKNDCFKFEG